jgi:hypothetical protein
MNGKERGEMVMGRWWTSGKASVGSMGEFVMANVKMRAK